MAINQPMTWTTNNAVDQLYQMEFSISMGIHFSSFFSSAVFICVRKIDVATPVWLLPFDENTFDDGKRVAYNGINYRFIYSVCGCAICRRPNHSTPISLSKEISKQTYLYSPAWIGWKHEEKKWTERKFRIPHISIACASYFNVSPEYGGGDKNVAMALPHHIHYYFFFHSYRKNALHCRFVEKIPCIYRFAAWKWVRCAVWRHLKFNIAIALITTVTCAIITAIPYLHSNVNIGHASTSLSILLTLHRTHLGALRRNNGNAHTWTRCQVFAFTWSCVAFAVVRKRKTEIRWELWRESNATTYGVFDESNVSLLSQEQPNIRFDNFYFIIKMILDLLRFSFRLCANKRGKEKSGDVAYTQYPYCNVCSERKLNLVWQWKDSAVTHSQTHGPTHNKLCAHMQHKDQTFLCGKWKKRKKKHSLTVAGVRVMPWQMGKYFNPNGMSKQHPFPLCAGVPFNKLHRRNLHFVLGERAIEWKREKQSVATKAFTKMKFNRDAHISCHTPVQQVFFIRKILLARFKRNEHFCWHFGANNRKIKF